MHCTTCGAATAGAATACAACGAARVARPLGVGILAVLDLVGGGFLAVMGLASIGLAGVGSTATPAGGPEGATDVVSGFLFLLTGAFALGFGAVFGVAGWGLWKGRSWGRILHLALHVLGIAFAALGLAFGVLAMDSPSPQVVVAQLVLVGVNGFLVWYFVQPDVKRWFGA